MKYLKRFESIDVNSYVYADEIESIIDPYFVYIKDAGLVYEIFNLYLEGDKHSNKNAFDIAINKYDEPDQDALNFNLSDIIYDVYGLIEIIKQNYELSLLELHIYPSTKEPIYLTHNEIDNFNNEINDIYQVTIRIRIDK